MNVRDIFETMEYGPAPEDAGEAAKWLDGHGRKFGQFIGGTFTKPGKGFESRNPATGEVLAKVSQASAKDVDAAVFVTEWNEFRDLDLDKVKSLIDDAKRLRQRAERMHYVRASADCHQASQRAVVEKSGVTSAGNQRRDHPAHHRHQRVHRDQSTDTVNGLRRHHIEAKPADGEDPGTEGQKGYVRWRYGDHVPIAIPASAGSQQQHRRQGQPSPPAPLSRAGQLGQDDDDQRQEPDQVHHPGQRGGEQDDQGDHLPVEELAPRAEAPRPVRA